MASLTRSTRRARSGRQAARTLLTTAAAALALFVSPELAGAQAVPAPAAAPAAAPPPAAPSEELPPPPPPSYAGGECTPACRSGFLCHLGQCVSACNPPCVAGEQCTAQGECVVSISTGGYGAPSFPEPEELEAPPPPDGVEQHDGFMLRLALGGGGGAATLEPLDTGIVPAIDISGGGVAFSLDLGGAPIDDLVIHVRISEFVMVEPSVEVAGTSDALNGSFGSSFFGLGLTYYFMPINLYLTAALGPSWLALNVDGDGDGYTEDPRSTDAGFGFNFDVGKEWWVSDNWGLGLAGRFVLTSGTTTNDESGLETDFAMTAFAISFSATYQ